MARDAGEGMALSPTRRGSLAELSFPELLKELHQAGHEGSLRLERQGIVKTLLLQDGRVVFARSNNPDDRLGEFLVRRGVISLEQYLQSVEYVKRGSRQGKGLVELGAISAEELVQHVKEQVQEILYSLFRWTRADFEIRSEALPADEMIILNVSMEEIICTGMRRVQQFTPIWRGLGASPHEVLAQTPQAGSIIYRVSLSEDESAVLSLVNGKFDISQILSMSYVSNFEALRSLWALKVMGVIEPVGARPSREAQPGEDYELEERIELYHRLFSVVHDFIAERLGELVDHLTDRAVAQAAAQHHRVLREVRMHNGRVEYEQIYANASDLAEAERRSEVAQTLDELLFSLLKLTRKELGIEEEQALIAELRERAPQPTQAALEAILARL